ncbi:MAG: hypothetical protein GY744_12485 [Gammaproteobacteria bacterium]|nr:hypothetical protein [Gammaproteobacteria bacterium]
MKNTLMRSILTVLLLLASTQLWAEIDCSKEAIGFYLDRGFTTDQVTQMCQCSGSSTSVNKSTTPTAIAASVPVVTSVPGTANQNLQNTDELHLFSASIVADTLSINSDTLTYVNDGCMRYGEEDITGFRPKVCGVFKTTIKRVGLKVLSAKNGLSIIRDAEFIVQGDIQREVLNINELSDRNRKKLKKVFVASPEIFEIQTRKGADVKKAAEQLPR